MAGFKLALDAGHYKYTSGRRCLKEYDPKETREWELNDRVCDWIAQYAAQYEGFETMRVEDPTGEQDVGLHDRAEAANKWQADLYYSAHHNAGIKGGDGGGVTAYCSTTDPISATWRDGLYDAIIKATGLKGNRYAPKTSAQFVVLVETDMPAVLIEHGFMDSSADIPVITSEEYPRKVGEAVAAYIAARAGLQKKDNPPAELPADPPAIIDPPTEPELPDTPAADNPAANMTAIDRVIARARAELGYIEKASREDLDDKTANAGNRNFTKYARDLDALGIYNGKKQGFDWCDVACDYFFIMEFGKDLGLQVICQPEKSYGAGVNSSARYYKQQGRLDKNPAVGDQVYFIGSDGLYYHTGLVVAVDEDTITTIEGNAGKGSTRVVETVYNRTDKKLGAFGHPRWELVEAAAAPESPETPAEEETPAENPPAAPAAPESAQGTKYVPALGDIVRLKNAATVYCKPYRFSEWVYDRDLYVRAIKGDKVTISTQATGAVTGSVAADMLELVKSKNGASAPKIDETPKAEETPAETDKNGQDAPSGAEDAKNALRVGDKVRLRKNATNYRGTTMYSAWVYFRDMYIIQLDGDRAVISTQPGGAATGAVNVKDLTKV